MVQLHKLWDFKSIILYLIQAAETIVFMFAMWGIPQLLLTMVYALILSSVSIVLSYPAFAEYEYFQHLNVKDSFNDCFLYCLNETEIIDNNCHMMHISGGYILGQSKKEYMIIYL